MEVSTSDSANDTAATSARTTRYGRFRRGGLGPGAPTRTPADPRRGDDHGRPHQVELLFDAQ